MLEMKHWRDHQVHLDYCIGCMCGQGKYGNIEIMESQGIIF